MRQISVWAVFCVFSSLCWAESALDALRGEYVILEQNGDSLASGTARIVADANTVGVFVSGLPLASRPVSSLNLLTPVTGTEVSQNDSRILQRYTDGRGTTRVEYTQYPGFLEIQTEVCVEGDGCDRNRLVAAQTASPGNEVDFDAFFSAHNGTYQIRTAGGSVPKPENREATVDGSFGFLMLPYCQPGGACNPGYIFTDRSNTRIFQRDGDGFTQFNLVVTASSKTKVYSWVDYHGGDSFVRDFDYLLNDIRVCMEHVLTR